MVLLDVSVNGGTASAVVRRDTRRNISVGLANALRGDMGVAVNGTSIYQYSVKR